MLARTQTLLPPSPPAVIAVSFMKIRERSVHDDISDDCGGLAALD